MVSIIIPIYNVEKYLNRCISSVRNQTYKDIEIILVDDGSPDRCGEICDYYSKIDKRIVVIHKQNGGLSEARNFGIAKAKGEYIAFVDSDDYVSDKYIETLYDICKNYNCEIAQCDYFDSYDNSFDNQSFCEDIVIESGNEHVYKFVFNREIQDIVVWNKLYKKSLFDDIKFPVGKIHEDEFISYKLYYNANRIGINSSKLYAYYQSENSIMRSEFSLNRLDILEAFEEKYEFLKRNNFNKSVIDRIRLELVYNLVYYYYCVKKNISDNKLKLKDIKIKFNKNYYFIITNKNFNIKNKLAFTLFYFSPLLYSKLKLALEKSKFK